MAIVTLASLQDVGDDDDEVELVPQEEAEEEDETGTSHLKAFVFLALFQFHWDKSFLALVSCVTSGTPGDPSASWQEEGRQVRGTSQAGR